VKDAQLLRADAPVSGELSAETELPICKNISPACGQIGRSVYVDLRGLVPSAQMMPGSRWRRWRAYDVGPAQPVLAQQLTGFKSGRCALAVMSRAEHAAELREPIGESVGPGAETHVPRPGPSHVSPLPRLRRARSRLVARLLPGALQQASESCDRDPDGTPEPNNRYLAPAGRIVCAVSRQPESFAGVRPKRHDHALEPGAFVSIWD
jgi:hypothetical protein